MSRDGDGRRPNPEPSSSLTEATYAARLALEGKGSVPVRARCVLEAGH
ncbi:hypothetical protein NJ7G_0150 [Natrinema sp. J7-2]|nr:hypothetical protein NJ7G_0150 [Natrinema sp. J7-2]